MYHKLILLTEDAFTGSTKTDWELVHERYEELLKREETSPRVNMYCCWCAL